MGIDSALDMGREALYLALLASAPVLIIGLIVGLAISILQAVTQLQEQTLTFVPKIVAMVVAAVIFTPWIATLMLDYTREMFGTFP
jgi:flagellar biosynthetic protein FliQ